MRRSWANAAALVLAIPWGAGCGTVSPDEVPAAVAAVFTPAVEQAWPGAKAILAGLDVAGERQLRDGDAVLYGIEIVRGDVITHNLLRIDVQRGKPANDTGTLTFLGFEAERKPPIPNRVVRQVELQFTLFDAAGTQLMRSRSEPTPDFFFEESFVRGIVAARHGDSRNQGIASARLLQIVRLLQQDPILKRLLGEVASVPFDLRLLFRRDITLVTSFENGSPVPDEVADPFAGQLGARYDLPFDLLLNDSAFVRLSATVVDPLGPTGATAGILLLRAQQADEPTRQLRLQLLACARGPRTDWQAHGVLTACGGVDEGTALAFSPDGRFVAMPGERGVVELRELTTADPTVPAVLRGAAEAVGALAFLDATTLLVGRGARVEVFAVGRATAEEPCVPIAVVPTQRAVRAIEVATGRTCFVGMPAGEVERWTFAGPLSMPTIESVRAPVGTEARIGDGPPMPLFLHPSPGFLVAGNDAERVVVGAGGKDFEYQRGGDGRWTATALPALPKGHSRGERWRRPGAPVFDAMAFRAGYVHSPDGRYRNFGGNALLVNGNDRTWLVGRGHPDKDAVVHGIDPSSRYWAFVAPGYRVLVDCSRTP